MRLDDGPETNTFKQFVGTKEVNHCLSVDELRKVFNEKLPKEGVELEDKSFVPHITLLKMRNRSQVFDFPPFLMTI